MTAVVVVERDDDKTFPWGVFIERGRPPEVKRTLWCRYEDKEDAMKGKDQAVNYVKRMGVR